MGRDPICLEPANSIHTVGEQSSRFSTPRDSIHTVGSLNPPTVWILSRSHSRQALEAMGAQNPTSAGGGNHSTLLAARAHSVWKLGSRCAPQLPRRNHSTVLPDSWRCMLHQTSAPTARNRPPDMPAKSQPFQTRRPTASCRAGVRTDTPNATLML